MLHKILFVVLFVSSNIRINVASPEDDFKAGNRLFSARLYKEMNTKPKENFVFSPYPVQKVLAALASAAKSYSSDTVAEIKNSVNLLQDKVQNEEAFKNVCEKMKKYNDDDFKLFDATKMYFTQGYSVEQWYRTIAQQVYEAEIETVNFGQSAATTQRINSWVSKKTDGKITNFIKPGDITSNTQNVLVSTFYLAAKWETPFEKAETMLRNFNTSTEIKKVNMMKNTAGFGYFKDEYAKYLQMGLFKYEGDAEVVFVLPHDHDGLGKLEANIERVFQQKTFVSSTVNVVLPKFSISNDVKLMPILQKLGVKRLFNWGVALEGLKYPGHPFERISDVYQMTTIDVTESGVSAAAATESEIIVDKTLDERTFVADHPFIFYISIEKVIVFAGRVVDP
ncbi:serine protease inhibitor 42Dd-like [Anthonomus grandis grandis]|uniref:serine protease inhibitor 42Dd-like n=1 Tax=Anthonomus grandis grandis TaxID=2921223 RepID=UPI00216512F5|nr:serine protease inhibitor 42Dd-like [Anthonomus grandis grandis]